jgi:phosphoglycerol transferase
MGSSVQFGGLHELFSSHGDTEILDYDKMIDEGFIDKNYRVFWGVEDAKMYDYSKQKLNEISEGDEPFFFVMETVDTHNPDGWVCDKCQDEQDTRYGNVVSCASRQVFDFIEWSKQQPWYDNTTIIIVGDHLSMKNNFFTSIDSDYERTTLNLFINVPEGVVNDTTKFTNRKFSSADMFPTALAAIGCTIDGNQLGLGVNLFSTEKTIFERFGFEYVNEEFKKHSTFYENVFVG